MKFGKCKGYYFLVRPYVHLISVYTSHNTEKPMYSNLKSARHSHSQHSPKSYLAGAAVPFLTAMASSNMALSWAVESLIIRFTCTLEGIVQVSFRQTLQMVKLCDSSMISALRNGKKRRCYADIILKLVKGEARRGGGGHQIPY